MVTMIRSDSVSEAWHSAAAEARKVRHHKIYHLIVNIRNPTSEQADVRRKVDELLAECDLQAVETVANTIMPAQLARLYTDHADLVERYRALYERLMRFPKNSWGTYFGRLVAYPVGHDRRPPPVDQIGPIIKALTRERKVAAEYETAITVAGEASQDNHAEADALIHHPTRGAHGRGGPCLSYVSFQRDDRRVHATAHYRSQYLIERAYGNYLGLGRLLEHVATQAGLDVGRLTVVSGYAQLDQRLREIDKVFPELA